MQISGQKTFTTYPAQTPYISAQQQEEFHASGDNILPWGPTYNDTGTAHEMAPGDALFVPYKSPHKVKVTGAEPSISLSITWRTAFCDAQDNACRLNAVLRRTGLSPAAPTAWPASHRTRDILYRIYRKTGAR